METYKTLILTTTWLTFAFSLALFGLEIYNELRWQKRDSINYNNFESKQKFFNQKITIWGIVCTSILGVLCILSFIGINVFASTFEGFEREFFPLNGVPSACVAMLASVPVLQYIRKTKNKDLSLVASLHTQVKTNLENQRKLTKNLEDYKALQEKYVKSTNNAVKIFQSFASGDLGLDLSCVMQELDNIIKDCDGRLSGFDNLITTRFDKMLSEYLVTDDLNTNTLSEEFLAVAQSIDELEQNIINKTNTILTRCAVEILDKKLYKNVGKVIELFNYFKATKLSPTAKMIEPTCRILNEHKELSKDLMPLLLGSSDMSSNVYTNLIVKNNYFWLLNFSFDLPPGALIRIGEALIVQNEHKFSEIYFMRLKSNKKQTLQAAISLTKDTKIKEGDNNIVLRQFQNYHVFLCAKPPRFDSKQKETEDRFYSLVSYAKLYPDKRLRAGLETIMMSGDFRGEKEFLDSSYEKVKGDNAILTLLCKSIVLFFLNCPKANNVFKDKSVLTLFHIYLETLNFRGLEVLAASILAVILLFDEEKYTIQAREFLVAGGEHFTTALPSPEMNNKTAAKAVIAKLQTDKLSKTFLNVVNTVEIERLTYKKLMTVR